MYKLYKIVNLKNNKVYIGMTKNSLEKRFYQHCFISKTRNTSLYNSMKKHGIENFKIELLNTYNNKKDCCKAEIENILLNKNNSYNLAKGGEGGFVVNNIEDWKSKLSEKRQGRKPSLGMNHSESNKQLFSKISKQYWLENKIYNNEEILKLSFKEAKLKFNISKTHYYRIHRQFRINASE
jgi:group I intron endonuclease